MLELGSGAGLCSLVVSHFARALIATDYQDIVLNLLQDNIANYVDAGKCVAHVAKLEWGATQYQGLNAHTTHTPIDAGLLRGLDCIIGSDIVYWESSVEPLFATLNVLFASSLRKSG